MSDPSLERCTEFGDDCIFVKTVRKHVARSHLSKSRFRSRAPLLQEERLQLEMSRFTSRSLALDHTHRC